MRKWGIETSFRSAGPIPAWQWLHAPCHRRVWPFSTPLPPFRTPFDTSPMWCSRVCLPVPTGNSVRTSRFWLLAPSVAKRQLPRRLARGSAGSGPTVIHRGTRPCRASRSGPPVANSATASPARPTAGGRGGCAVDAAAPGVGGRRAGAGGRGAPPRVRVGTALTTGGWRTARQTTRPCRPGTVPASGPEQQWRQDVLDFRQGQVY